MSQKNNYIKVVIDFIASKRFFYVVICLFILQATWIGLSNNYGSPHDEKYHLGLIQAYSHDASPFMNGQPVIYDQLGDVARSNSYLYHYSLSLPYRLISSISSNLMFQVIFLRLLNILFVALGLFIFKKILDDISKKPIISNLALYAVVMIPVVTYVAAGINYDNLVFLGFAVSLYLTVRLTKQFRLNTAILWLAANILTVLVKFSYGPLAFVLVIGTAIYYFIDRKLKSPQIKQSTKGINKVRLVASVLLLIIASGLFVERYVGNYATYGSPTPDCAKVLSAERCSLWGPWKRNADVKQKNADRKRVGIISYTKTWVRTMESSSFGIYKNAITKDALPVIGFAGWITLIMLVFFVAINVRYIIKKPDVLIAVGSVMFYVAALFVVNYRDYQSLGAPVAIQGRYLILPMPLLIGMTLFFANKLFSMKKYLWPIFVVLWLTIFLQGGVVTYIVSSDPVWWWKDNTVINVNETAQKILIHLVIKN